MGDKFLGGNSSNLTNGTANLYISTLTIDGLDASQPIKTNATKTIISQNLDISDINNLQSELNSKLINPAVSDIDLNSFNIVDVGVIELNKISPAPDTPVGALTLYASSVDGQFHKKDELGNDTVLASYNQSLNTTDPSTFTAVTASNPLLDGVLQTIGKDATRSSFTRHRFATGEAWQTGMLLSDEYKISGNAGDALTINRTTNDITTSSKMLVGDDLETNGNLLLKNAGVLETSIKSLTGGGITLSDIDDNEVVRIAGKLNVFRRSGDNTAPVFITGEKVRGTIDAPTAIINGDFIRMDYAIGHDGVNLNVGVQRVVRATENWSPGNHGSSYSIQTCNNGSSSEIERLLIDTSGTSIKTNLTVDGNADINEGVLTIDTTTDAVLSHKRSNVIKWLVGNEQASSDSYIFKTASFDNTLSIKQDKSINFYAGSPNSYVLPLTRGTAGQMLITDAAGQTSWAPTTGIFSQTGDLTVSGSTLETSIIAAGVGSLTIPANGFSVGNSFVAKIGGSLVAANGNTLQIRVKSVAVLLADFIVTMDASTSPFELELDFTVAAVGIAGVAIIKSNGNFVYQASGGGGAYVGANYNGSNTTTFDTTIANTLDITVQHSNAAQVFNNNMCILTRTYP